MVKFIGDNIGYLNRMEVLFDDIECSKVLINDQMSEKDLEANLLVYMINPEQVGRIEFINNMKEVMMYRNNYKTIVFCIDDTYLYDKSDLMKVEMELEKSIPIKTPQIIKISSYLTLIYNQYIRGDLTVEMIQKDKRVSFVDADGDLIIGRRMNHEHMKHFNEIDGFSHLHDHLHKSLSVMNDQSISIKEKQMRLVDLGSVDKQLFAQNVLSEIKDVVFTDEDHNLIDKTILLFDLSILATPELLEEHIMAAFDQTYILVCTNIDQYMFYKMNKLNLIRKIENWIASFTDKRIYFISDYYLSVYQKLRQGLTRIDDIKQVIDIVVTGDYGLPTEVTEESLINDSHFEAFLLLLEEISC